MPTYRGRPVPRRLKQRIRKDLAFRYLAGGARPDFWALNEFRNRHGRALNDVFTQVVELARSLAMGKLGHLRPHVPSDGRYHD
jgi:transposase